MHARGSKHPCVLNGYEGEYSNIGVCLPLEESPSILLQPRQAAGEIEEKEGERRGTLTSGGFLI